MSNFNVIGKSIPRHDALQQVTGKVIYGEDLYRPNMLYAKALYSEYSHAKIISVDVSDAEKIAGVIAIITAKDVPYNRFGYSHKDQPVLAEDKVCYKGDAIAVVAAESKTIAEEAIRRIRVEYTPLPTVFDPIEAIKEQAPLVHENGNLAAHIKIRKGDVVNAFDEADLVVEDLYTTQKVEHCHIEPHVALAEVENDGNLIIWTANSRPFVFATQLSKILQLPLHKFQIKTPAVGGGFGGKNDISIEPWVALLALKSQRPVKMVFTREEEFTVSTVRHPYIMKYKSALKDGLIIARQVELISDSGAYVSLGKDTLTKAALHCIGPYHVPNVKVDAYLAYTNNIVGGAMRGFGVPQVCFAHEVHTDHIAQKLGIDPLEFRLKNLFTGQGHLPCGQVIDTSPLRETLQRAIKLHSSPSGRE